MANEMTTETRTITVQAYRDEDGQPTCAKIMRLSSEIIRTITGRKQRTELAHTDQATTRGYLRWRETPVSEVVMRLPNGIK